MPSDALPKDRVTNEQNVHKLHTTSRNIASNVDQLKKSLLELEAEIKIDEDGQKEYETFLHDLNKKKKALEKEVTQDKEWIEAFEKEQESGGFEQQYKVLLEQIQNIYETAKEFHSKGIEMLIQEFDYHIAYKRWNDTFTAVPFKPK
ncbi:hypothetical protein BSKO_04067 [Bryopsis sp. KO-2023]|nr:hypothetical protein BSKO_04067 [Bryopsis sp. KO-2023]